LVLRCFPSGWTRTEAVTRACDRWEPAPECLACGACCREAFDAVEITRRDPVRALHPELVEAAEGRLRIRRAAGNRCGAMELDSYVCTIYGDRPRCCRDFERSGPNCHFARERVGLTLPWAD
jgi:Fe-S-cluster containining protein